MSDKRPSEGANEERLIAMPPLHSQAAEDFAKAITNSPAMQALAKRVTAHLGPDSIFDEATLARIRAYGSEVRGTLDAVLPPLGFDATDTVGVTDTVDVQIIPGPTQLPDWAAGLMANSPAKVIAVAVGCFQLLLASLPDDYDGKSSAAMLTIVWTMAWILASEALKDR